MSDSEELMETNEGGDDLFGDDDDAASGADKTLGDRELASDPEEGSAREQSVDSQTQVKNRFIMEKPVFRHKIPKPADNQLRILRVPDFLRFIPEPYDRATFQPTEFDITNAREANPKRAVRFTQDPDTGEMKSNANIYRWSDGSVTMSVGNEHYELPKKELAPQPGKPYQEVKDSHYYAASAQLDSNVLLVVGHVGEQYTVRPPKAVEDKALARLAERMAEAARMRNRNDIIIRIAGDPEAQKKKAEAAEKERLRAERKRDNALARMDGGVKGFNGRGGLAIGELDAGGRRTPGGARKRGAPGSGRQRRRRPEYDSDDDPQGPRGTNEYDVEDDFIAPSDDSEVEAGDDDDDDELDDDEDDRAPPKAKRQRTADPDDEDADGEADVDDEPAAAESSARVRRRHIVDDDDDE